MPADRPFLFNSGVDALRRAQLEQAADDRFFPSGRALTWPITIHSDTTDVVPDAASSSIRYVRSLNSVDLWFNLNISLLSVGGANWNMVLPAVAGTFGIGSVLRGAWKAVQFPSNSVITGWVEISSVGGVAYFMCRTTAGLGAQSIVGSLIPFTWGAAGGTLSGFITYEAADLYTP